MKIFSDIFKLYAYKNRDKCDLSIRLTDQTVLTFKLTHSEFKKILNSRISSNEFSTDQGQYWFICNKNKFECIRITVSFAGLDFNFRVNYNDFDELQKEYARQMSSPQYWD